MEYKLIIAQETPGKHGANWSELREEIERKIKRILVVLDAYRISIKLAKMRVDEYHLIFIGGINSTFEKTDTDICLTLSQAILIPKEVSEYLNKKEEEDSIADECFRF